MSNLFTYLPARMAARTGARFGAPALMRHLRAVLRCAIRRPRRYLHIATLLALGSGTLLTGMSGCTTMGYFGQSIGGQLEVLAASRSIQEILDDPATPKATRERLASVLEIRNYATRELALPDNDSYRRYADLRRPYVVWNVFAAPELSLTPRQWCFPVAGCVAYRGYFSQQEARKFAAGLRAQGDDVQVAGVSAYSTLGWFNDPLLSAQLHYSDADLAGLIFHELAHQRVYVAGDTAFNESFAMTVELEGTRRWLEDQGRGHVLERTLAAKRRHEQFVELVMRHRDRLAAVYAGRGSVAEKRADKVRILDELRQEYAELKNQQWDGYDGYDRWFSQDLNNAKLAAVGVYHHHVAAFQALLARSDGDLRNFYRAAGRLARLPASRRETELVILEREKAASDVAKARNAEAGAEL